MERWGQAGLERSLLETLNESDMSFSQLTCYGLRLSSSTSSAPITGEARI